MNITRTALKTITLAFCKDEDGATAIEYGLFAALVGAVIVGTVATLGTNTNKGFTTLNEALEEANGTSTAAAGTGG